MDIFKQASRIRQERICFCCFNFYPTKIQKRRKARKKLKREIVHQVHA